MTQSSKSLKLKKNSSRIKDMFEGITPRYDLLNRCLSLGQDLFWRRALARRLKADNPDDARFLDLATGTGDQLLINKQNWPKASLTGLDFSKSMLEAAKVKIDKFSRRLSAPLPVLVEADALQAPFDEGSFDSVSISFGLRNIADRMALYKKVLKILKPGGRFLVLDLYFDDRQPLSSLYLYHLKHLTPFLAGALFWDHRQDYKYLTSSILAFPHPAIIADEMKQAGFTGLDLLSFSFGTTMLVWGHKPNAAD
jgi:demethylmenaquinone methyltransferase/2-methoxy-6-polyprenyl-1,4-benzoquinol methylase